MEGQQSHRFLTEYEVTSAVLKDFSFQALQSFSSVVPRETYPKKNIPTISTSSWKNILVILTFNVLFQY